MIMLLARYAFIALALLLSACASTPPFSADRLGAINRALIPEQAAQMGAKGEKVLWGGVIVSAQNTPTQTDITVLAYPLADNQRPQLNLAPQGRFIVHHHGYLETLVYAPGRQLTILGVVQGMTEGKVGEAPYRYPEVKSEDLYLWSPGTGPRVRFGVGVGVGVHM